MPGELESTGALGEVPRAARARLGLRGELLLAVLPTVTVLAMLAVVDALTEQRLLFASLASSAFLIYLDPQHDTNSVRTLVLAQGSAAVLGWGLYLLLGSSYASAGLALGASIVAMIVVDAVHPPAVATAMSFALRAGGVSNLVLFGLALLITAALVLLERAVAWLLAWHTRAASREGTGVLDR